MIFPRYRYRYYHYETPSHHSTSFKFSCIFCSVKGWKCSFLQCTPKLITKFSVGWWLGVKEKISNRANQYLQCRIKMCFLMITSPGYLRNSDEKLLHMLHTKLPCRNAIALEFSSVYEIKHCRCSIHQDMLQNSFFFTVRMAWKVLGEL